MKKFVIPTLTIAVGLLLVRFALPWLSTHVVGESADQLGLLWHMWWERWSGSQGVTLSQYLPFYYYGETAPPFMSNQPVMRVILMALSSIVGDIAAYNLIILAAFPLTFIFTFLLINRFVKNKMVAGTMSILYSHSAYLVLQARSHIELSQLWLIPLGILLVEKYFEDNSRRTTAMLIGVLVLVGLTANYYGYILLLYFVVSFLVRRKFMMRSLGVLISTAIIGLSVMLFSMGTGIKDLFLNNGRGSTAPLPVVGRGLEDFITFSSRPWHFILPPSQHPQLGWISTNFNNWLFNTKDYFLFYNYFPEEHSGLYIGWGVLILLLYSAYRFWRKSVVSRWLVVTAIFLILSAPPFFTLAGQKIYLPSIVLQKATPMFRVIARFSVVIYLSILIVCASGLKHLYDRLRVSWKRGLLLSGFLLFSLYEQYVPLGYFSTTPPPVYSWLSQQPYTLIMEYPYEATRESLFWMRVYKKGLINPWEVKTEEFESKKFTRGFVENPKSFGVLDGYNVGLILVHEDLLGENKESVLSFFRNHRELGEVGTFGGVIVFANQQ